MELLINKIWLFSSLSTPPPPPHISSLLQFPHFSASFLCTRVSSILTLGLSLADWLLLKTPTLTSQAQVRSITFCSKPDDRLYFFISLPTLLHHQLGWQKIKNWTNIQMTPWWLIIFSASKQTERRKANVSSILYFVDMFQVKFKFLSMSLSNINKTWNTVSRISYNSRRLLNFRWPEMDVRFTAQTTWNNDLFPNPIFYLTL